MRRFILSIGILLFGVLTLQAHPGIGIVQDTQGNIFYTDLVHVWKISPDGERNIAVRAGNHCTQPIMTRYDIPATTRASFAFYNTKEEVDQLVAAVKKVQEMFS